MESAGARKRDRRLQMFVRLYNSSKSGSIIELSLFLWGAIEGSRKEKKEEEIAAEMAVVMLE